MLSEALIPVRGLKHLGETWNRFAIAALSEALIPVRGLKLATLGLSAKGNANLSEALIPVRGLKRAIFDQRSFEGYVDFPKP